MRRLMIGVVAACLVALGMAGVAESQTCKYSAQGAEARSAPGYVCRMTNSAERIADCGTGTLIYKDTRIGGVLSCKHILSGGVGKLSITFPSINQQYMARLVAADPRRDLSFWIIQAPPIEPCPMASDYASTGQQITLMGLGQGCFRAQRGQVKGYRKTTNMGSIFELSGGSRGGDSGGPVLNERGELTGVLWGTMHNTTSATFIGDIHVFLCSDRYAFPWNAELADKKDARKHEANQPLVPILQPVAPHQPAPPVDLSGINASIADLRSDVKDNEARLAPLEATADKARQLAEGWPELQAAMKKLEISTTKATADAKTAVESVTVVADLAGDAVDIAGDANATVKAALDEDAPDGLVARIRGKVHDRLQATITAKLADKVGWSGMGIGGVIVAFVIWLVRKDVLDKARTGDPLMVTKLREKLAEARGRLKARRDEEEYEYVYEDEDEDE